ncbi:hypothetical protein [Pantoea sp. 1.19]|uniref:hypothetical protein n=1 Tax=Pantoea sp. 1.19 TaxID=1925589 RepID=UPI000948D745|nr:hypothetical protein [Pantoea sp. 1.19]
MKAYFPAMLGVLLTSWTTFSAAEHRAAPAASGTITFVGTVVESPCEFQSRQQQLISTCYHQGTPVSKTLLLDARTAQTLPLSIGDARLRWLDAQQRLGVLTVNYR